MSAALAELRRLYAERDGAARAWKAAGGKVVGYVGRAPEALIAAAGCLPYRLSGDPAAGDTALRRHLYPLFNKAQAVRGLIAREQPLALLEGLFGGRFAMIDRLLVVADRKDVSQLLGQVRAAKAADPALPLPEVHVLDRAPAQGFAASQYGRESLRRLRQALEGWTGRAVTEADLQAAVADWNAGRAAAARWVDARAAGRIGGRDALAGLGAGWLASKAEHARRLDAALAELPVRPGGPPRVRLALLGSPLDHDRVHAAVEALGAEVVYDGHDWGEAGLQPPLAADLPPFEAMVEQFNATPPGLSLPLAEAAARLANAARAAGAQGAVVLAHRGDTLAAFDAPDLVRACESAGLAVLHLAEQPYSPEPQALHAALTPFVAALDTLAGRA